MDYSTDVLGGNDWLSLGGILGGTTTDGINYSGWLSPTMQGLTSGLGLLQGLGIITDPRTKAIQKQNEFKMKQVREMMKRQQIDQHNKIAQARRYQQLALGSGNDGFNTVSAVVNNPYQQYGSFIG